MSDQEDRLKRTELKYFGLYLLDNCGPGKYILEHDETEKEMMDRAYQKLESQLEGLEEKQVRKIMNAAAEFDADSQRAGFYSGMKAGARLIFNLLDGGEIIF